MESKGIKVEGVAPLLEAVGLLPPRSRTVTFRNGKTMLVQEVRRSRIGAWMCVLVPRENLCSPDTPGVPNLTSRDLGLTDPRSLVRPLHHATWPGMTPQAIDKVREKLGHHRGRGR